MTEVHVTDWPVESDFQDSYAYDLANSPESWAPEFAASAYREQCRFALNDYCHPPKVVPVSMTYRWERRLVETELARKVCTSCERAFWSDDELPECGACKPIDIMATIDSSWADF